MYLPMKVKITLWMEEPQEGLGGCKMLDSETIEMIAQLPVHRDDYDADIDLEELFWDHTKYVIKALPAVHGKISANVYLLLRDNSRDIAKYITPEYPVFRAEFTLPDFMEEDADILDKLWDIFWDDSRYDVERTQ